MRGTVKNWVEGKAFGFIRPDQPNHDDCFLHENELPEHVRAEPERVGLIVEFDPVDVGKARMSAKNVTVLGEQHV
jgi:cold shock CspA family protein